MDKVLIYILLFVAIYFIFFNNNNKEHFDNISDEWKNTIKHQCDRLSKEIDVINNLLGNCSTNIDINGKVNCRDFEEIQINSSREKDAWCGLNDYISSENQLNKVSESKPKDIEKHMEKYMEKHMEKHMDNDNHMDNDMTKEHFTNYFDIQGYDYNNKYN